MLKVLALIPEHWARGRPEYTLNGDRTNPTVIHSTQPYFHPKFDSTRYACLFRGQSRQSNIEHNLGARRAVAVTMQYDGQIRERTAMHHPDRSAHSVGALQMH